MDELTLNQVKGIASALFYQLGIQTGTEYEFEIIPRKKDTASDQSDSVNEPLYKSK